MTQVERNEFVQKFFEEYCVKILNTKGNEYSLHQIDVNNNFKRAGNELEIEPKKILWIFLKKHLDAILAFINKGNVESEPIEGRIGDAINYLFILASLIEEDKPKIKCNKFSVDAYPREFCCFSFDHQGNHSWEQV